MQPCHLLVHVQVHMACLMRILCNYAIATAQQTLQDAQAFCSFVYLHACWLTSGGCTDPDLDKDQRIFILPLEVTRSFPNGSTVVSYFCSFFNAAS